MPSRAALSVKIAAEVWIASALLHIENPRRDDFAIGEILDRAKKEALTPALRSGVYVHIVQHCVANRPPNPARYRILVETSNGRRRLYRPGDSFHPAREGGKTVPEPEDIPSEYRKLLDWYSSNYVVKKPRRDKGDSILELRGLGKGLWKDEDPDSYVRRLREGWE